MKLWLLRPVKGAAPWDPWYDKAFGFVVRASSEDEARRFADEHAGDENNDNQHTRGSTATSRPASR